MAESPLSSDFGYELYHKLKTDHAMGRLTAYCESHNLAASALVVLCLAVLYICVSEAIDHLATCSLMAGISWAILRAVSEGSPRRMITSS